MVAVDPRGARERLVLWLRKGWLSLGGMIGVRRACFGPDQSTRSTFAKPDPRSLK